MSNENPAYDVAISFLVKDESIAAEMNRLLSQGLKVFFFPHKQEELAGTDGLESMRTPFYNDSRLMVVLYREPWGETPWTRVEQTAIQESCLIYGWQRLFFVALDRTSKLPVWIPDVRIRFNMEEFGLEQAVGAIKARVKELGGQYQPMTPAKRAALFKADEEYRWRLSGLNSSEGLGAINKSARILFDCIKAHIDTLAVEQAMDIECEIDFRDNSREKACVIRSGQVGMIVSWHQTYSNTSDGSELAIREYWGHLLFQSELGKFMVMRKPEVLKETKYSPYLSRTLEYGWKKDRSEAFISNSELADECAMRFIELMDAANSGRLNR